MKYVLLAFLAITIFSACSKDETQEIEQYIESKNLVGFTPTAEGVYIKFDNPGSDSKPNLGSTVTVHYKGQLTNGTVFDSSYDRGQPATFSLTGVIQGWQVAIPRFGVGGKGTIIVPPSLAYGKDGNSGIPGNSILIFDIELINFK